MEENKNVIIEEINEVEQTVDETEAKGFKAKAKAFIKKNGKKLAVGAVGLIGLGAAYALGRKSGEDEEDEDIDTDVIEIDFSGMDEIE